MPSISKEIVDAIVSKDNHNANEKVYDALYGKSSEQLQARKVQIAKHFFDPEYQIDQDKEEKIDPATPVAEVEPTEVEPTEPKEE
jgi:hypothetical protein